MGFLSRIRPKAMTSEDLARMIGSVYGGGSTSTGISVNTGSAMQAMCVHACVKIIADSFGMLPCHLMRKNGKNKEQAEDHPLFDLLNDQPCEYLTADKFCGMSAAHVKLQGNFFALKSNHPGRPIRELIPLAFGSVEEVIQAPDYGLFYKVRRPTGTGILDTSTTVDIVPGSRIMHIRGLVLNGFMGLNPVAYARESISLALATEKHGGKLFSHGTMIGGVIEFPAAVAPFKTIAAMRQYLADFNDTYSSIENAHKTAILQQGATWKPMAMTSVDSQFLEARNFQRQEIVQLFFGLPLGMMTTGDKVATFASSGNFSQDYVDYALMPLCVAAEKEVKRSLLTSEEKKTLYLKFNVAGLLRGKPSERAAYYGAMINSEVMNPNEARDLEDMNPYDGGDEYRTRTSSMKEPTGDQGGSNASA